MSSHAPAPLIKASWSPPTLALAPIPLAAFDINSRSAVIHSDIDTGTSDKASDTCPSHSSTDTLRFCTHLDRLDKPSLASDNIENVDLNLAASSSVTFAQYETVYSFADRTKIKCMATPRHKQSMPNMPYLPAPRPSHAAPPLAPSARVSNRSPRARLSLSALLPSNPGKLLRRLSASPESASPTANPRSPISFANQLGSSDTYHVETRPAPYRTSTVPLAAPTPTTLVIPAPSLDVEDPFCDSPRAIPEDADDESHGPMRLKHPRSDSDSTLNELSAPNRRASASAPPMDSTTSRAPASPIEAQRVWLCSPPKRQLTPVITTPPATFSGILPMYSPVPETEADTDTRTGAYCASPESSPPASPLGADFVLGPPVRRRPIPTRATSTGRLAHEFDERGGVMCLSVHSEERVLKVAEAAKKKEGRWCERLCPSEKAARPGAQPRVWRAAGMATTVDLGLGRGHGNGHGRVFLDKSQGQPLRRSHSELGVEAGCVDVGRRAGRGGLREKIGL